jgi:hypothetical protein
MAFEPRSQHAQRLAPGDQVRFTLQKKGSVSRWSGSKKAGVLSGSICCAAKPATQPGGLSHRHTHTVSLVVPDHSNLQSSGATPTSPNTPDQPSEG